MPATTRATRTRTIPTTTILIIQLGMILVRKRAVGKTSQALREGPPKLRQQKVELGGVAGVTAGGVTTTSSTATASGVAALQQGTGTTTTTAATGASFQMYFYLYFGVQQSPPAPTHPPAPRIVFLLPVILIIWLLQQTNNNKQTICISFKMMCIYDEIDAHNNSTHTYTHDLIIGYTTT